MDCVTLRSATPEDSEFTYAVKKAAFREYVEKVWGWDEDEQRGLHERRFRSNEYRVIRFDGVDVGILSATESPECVTLNQLYILPEHQGRGIGRECVSVVTEEARSSGLPVHIRVLRVNPRAIAFYERSGFRRVGETDSHVLMACGD